MLAFSPVIRIGTPIPHPQASVSPPFGSGGGTHLLVGEGMGWSQFVRGDRHCGTLGTYVCGDEECLYHIESFLLDR
jgi:hypothetical protein